MSTHTQAGWMFDYAVEPGSGLVIENVSHANYRLARDIRVVAVWAGTGDPTSPDPSKQGDLKKLRLGTADCPLQSGPTGTTAPAPPAGFGYHPARTGVSATFATPAAMFADTGGTDRLSITQDYQFCEYGVDPPHEPGGIVPAAHLLPLVSFRTEPTGNAPAKPLTYVRIDYRMHFALDSFDPAPPPRAPGSSGLTLEPNQVAIFRDEEKGPPIVGSQFRPLVVPFPPWVVLVPLPNIERVFLAGEKPMLTENVGRGLIRGKAFSPTDEPWTWDNSHQWPTLPGGKLPDTPGAFNCCHIHWRWGAVSGNQFGWAARFGILGKAGPQFRGLGWTPEKGGPVIDRQVSDQSMSFAIAEPRDAASADVSTKTFKDQFSSRGVPRNISHGSSIVQWYSLELFRTPAGATISGGTTWGGTVFIHGLYFAHSQEPRDVTVRAAAGSLTDALHVSKPAPGGWEISP